MIKTIIIAALSVSLLSAGWLTIQFLAKKIGTKNHFDNAGSCGNGCSCGGGICEKRD